MDRCEISAMPNLKKQTFSANPGLTGPLLSAPPQDSSVSSAISCARRVACTSDTSRSTSSRGCSSATSATSSSRRQSSCWSTRSATPSLPEGSSKESKYRQRFLPPHHHPINSLTQKHTYAYMYTRGVLA